MGGIIPCETGSHADKVMLSQGECFRMAIAQKRKQTDGGRRKENKC
jgi:hypothetical protein